MHLYFRGVIKLTNNILLSIFFAILTLSLFLSLHSQSHITIGLLLMAFVLFIIDFLIIIVKNKYIKLKRLKIVVSVFVIIVNAIVSLSVVVGLIANAEFFYPHQDISAFNELKTIPKMEKVTIKGDNNEIFSGWFVKNINKKAPLIIFFDGNGQCAATTCDSFNKNNYWSNFAGYNFLMIDYPGYGQSNKTPSEKFIFKMALATYDCAISRVDVDRSNIVVIGYSIGTGDATYLASQRDINGLILLAPFDEGLSLYNSQLNIFHGPLELLAMYNFKSIEYAKDVKVSPLIIASTDDKTISYTQSQKLSNCFSLKPKFCLLNGFDHNDFLGNGQVKKLMSTYLMGVLK